MKTRDLFSYPFHRVFGRNHTRVVPSDDELLNPSSIHIAGGVRAAAALIQLVCHVLSPSLGVREYCFAYLFSCFSSEHFLKCRALLCAPDSWRGSCEIIFHKIYECCSRREAEGGEREKMEVNNMESRNALVHLSTTFHSNMSCSRAGKKGEFTLGPIIFHLSFRSLLIPKAATNSHRSPIDFVWQPRGREEGSEIWKENISQLSTSQSDKSHFQTCRI